MSAKKHPVLDALKKDAKGLLFISETESKLTPFLWDADGPIDATTILKNPDYEYGPETAVATTTLDRFFRAVPKEDKAKFDHLAATLKAHLSDLRVYKLGEEGEKDVYIVGKTEDGKWAG